MTQVIDNITKMSFSHETHQDRFCVSGVGQNTSEAEKSILVRLVRRISHRGASAKLQTGGYKCLNRL